MKPPQYKLTEEMTADDAANGRAVVILRKSRHMSQKELAKALKVSASYLCDMEGGKRHLPYPLFNRAVVEILKFRKK